MNSLQLFFASNSYVSVTKIAQLSRLVPEPRYGLPFGLPYVLVNLFPFRTSPPLFPSRSRLGFAQIHFVTLNKLKMGNHIGHPAENLLSLPYWAKKVLTFDEAAEYTGLSKSYLYKLTAKGEVPHFKPRAKMIYFNREELETWLLQGKVKSAEEIEAIAASKILARKK
ncbi:helix-turn-helix domain-containing protein [Dyadobacter sp. 676]|uniref:Helix-turn-helix domain-containing protein n=1 Tax=Dyadobacter sp. 676 TaxID=3088362 RepID=A0AAU8FT22_9BACT